MKYELETKNRYRSETVAESYKEGYTKGYSLRILKNKLIVIRMNYKSIETWLRNDLVFI